MPFSILLATLAASVAALPEPSAEQVDPAALMVTAAAGVSSADDSVPQPDMQRPALADETPFAVPDPEPYRLSTFARQTKTVRWEVLGVAAAMAATRMKDITKGGSKFHFKNEGYFGKGTETLGMDKMHHAYKTTVIADVLDGLISKRMGSGRGAGTTSAILSLGLMTYGEILDGFTARTGFSNQDMVIHFAGAGIALLRNRVPGMRDKLDFRMHMIPTFSGEGLRLADQLDKRKYLLAGQLGGFKRWEDTPLKYVEVHLGYYGRGFTERDRLAGAPLKRRVFVGLGFNMQALFPKRPATRLGRLAKGTLDYIQVPYTLIN